MPIFPYQNLAAVRTSMDVWPSALRVLADYYSDASSGLCDSVHYEWSAVSWC